MHRHRAIGAGAASVLAWSILAQPSAPLVAYTIILRAAITP